MFSHPTSKITSTGKKRCFVRTYKRVTRYAKHKHIHDEFDDYCYAKNDLAKSLELERNIYREGQNKYRQEYLRMYGYYLNLVNRMWKRENPNVQVTDMHKKHMESKAAELADNDAFQAALTTMRELASNKPVHCDFHDTETIIDRLATRLMHEIND
jgi:hypothetical protein